MKLRTYWQTYLCLLALLFAWAGCSDDEATKNVILTGGTQTSQTVYADETQGSGGGISFTAVADWVATVTEVATSKAAGGSLVDWLTLSAYSGGAGEYTLTLTLKENNTGADRKAKIEIACAGDVITITVEQKGTTEEGDTPAEPVTPQGKRLARMEYTHVDSDYPENYDKDILTFAYDAEGRLSEMHGITYTGDEQSYYSDVVYTFSYEGSQLKIGYEDDEYSESSTYIATLNEAGYISLLYEEPEYSTTTTAWMFKYDSENYLQQILEDSMYEVDGEDGEDGDEPVVEDPAPTPGVAAWTRSFGNEMLNLTWQDGNLMSTIGDEPYNGNLMDWEYTSHLNETPGFDFNVMSRSLFGNVDAVYVNLTNMLFCLRMLGQGSKNLVKSDLVNWYYESAVTEPGPGESEPPAPTTETTHHDEWAPYEYSFTAENYLSRVTARCTLRTVTTEVATGEVLSETESYYDDEYVFTYEN